MNPPKEALRACGVGRNAEEPKSLLVYFNRPPTNDELRAVHDFLRHSPGICPFCSMPSYSLPCSNCGEPAIDQQF
jgi:hypothetical protein